MERASPAAASGRPSGVPAAGSPVEGRTEAKRISARFAEDFEQAKEEVSTRPREGRPERKAKESKERQAPGTGDRRADVVPTLPIWNPIWYTLPPISIDPAEGGLSAGAPDAATGAADSSAPVSGDPVSGNLVSGDEFSAGGKILPEGVLAPGTALLTVPLTGVPSAWVTTPAALSAPDVVRVPSLAQPKLTDLPRQTTPEPVPARSGDQLWAGGKILPEGVLASGAALLAAPSTAAPSAWITRPSALSFPDVVPIPLLVKPKLTGIPRQTTPELVPARSGDLVSGDEISAGGKIFPEGVLALGAAFLTAPSTGVPSAWVTTPAALSLPDVAPLPLLSKPKLTGIPRESTPEPVPARSGDLVSGDQLSAGGKILPEGVLAPGTALLGAPSTGPPSAWATPPALSAPDAVPVPSLAQPKLPDIPRQTTPKILPKGVLAPGTALLSAPSTGAPSAWASTPAGLSAPDAVPVPSLAQPKLTDISRQTTPEPVPARSAGVEFTGVDLAAGTAPPVVAPGLTPGLEAQEDRPDQEPALAAPFSLAPSALQMLFSAPQTHLPLLNPNPDRSREPRGVPPSTSGPTEAGSWAPLPLAFSARLDPAPGLAGVPEPLAEGVVIAEAARVAGPAAAASARAEAPSRVSQLESADRLAGANPVVSPPAAVAGEAGPNSGTLDSERQGGERQPVAQEASPKETGASLLATGANLAPSGGFPPGRAQVPGAMVESAPLSAPEPAPERLLPAPRELVLTLPAGENGSLTRVHVRDANGAVEVAVRTSDSQLSSSLQDGLPDLVRHLEAPGFAASATRGDTSDGPPADGSSAGGQDRERQDQPSSRDGQGGNQSQARGQPGEQRRERLARWRESLGLA